MKSTLFTNSYVHKYLPLKFTVRIVEHTSALLAIKACVCEVSYTYLLGCFRYREKHVKDVCYCLQTCNSVVYIVVMGLVIEQSLMVISTMGILLYVKVSPFIMYYGSALLLFTRKVHCL